LKIGAARPQRFGSARVQDIAMVPHGVARGRFGMRVLLAGRTRGQMRGDGVARVGRCFTVHVRRQTLVQLAALLDLVSHAS
jgi:hypothetical protein